MLGMMINSRTLKATRNKLLSFMVKPQSISRTFTTSDVWIKPSGVTAFDVTLVGAGGGGGPSWQWYESLYNAGGGGSGSVVGAHVNCAFEQVEYDVIVGTGPLGYEYVNLTDDIEVYDRAKGLNGEASQLKLGATTIASAAGGNGGWSPWSYWLYEYSVGFASNHGYGGSGAVNGGGNQVGTTSPSMLPLGAGGGFAEGIGGSAGIAGSLPGQPGLDGTGGGGGGAMTGPGGGGEDVLGGHGGSGLVTITYGTGYT